MNKVSGAAVARSLKESARRVKATVRQVNQKAAKQLARGDYAGAESLVQLAQGAADFAHQLEAIRDRWAKLWRARGRPGKTDGTPLWELYRPILRLLDGMGGQASGRDLERQFEATEVPKLKPGDLALASSGLARWKAMLGRARKAMIREGFLEPDKGKAWRITEAGKRATAS